MVKNTRSKKGIWPFGQLEPKEFKTDQRYLTTTVEQNSRVESAVACSHLATSRAQVTKRISAD